MARRKTIGKDPLAGLGAEIAAAEAVVAAPQAMPAAAAILSPPEPWRAPPPRHDPAFNAEREGRGAVGGKLEIFGGRLGSGTAVIWRFGPAERIGFLAPTGRLVDLASELDGVLAWPDRGDHRLASAAGWGWVLGSLAGAIGVVVGAGFRLLTPRRMLVRLSLGEGGEILARTDHTTVLALERVARAGALHRAAAAAGRRG